MTVSTDAMLIYGFDLGDPEDWEESKWRVHTPEELDQLSDHWDEVDDDQDIHYDFAYNWISIYRLRTGTLTSENAWSEEDLPVVLVSHCSGSHPMYAVAAKASVLTAGRGNPQEVDVLEHFDSDKEMSYRERIWEFCEVMGIEFEHPKWLLMSDWSS